MTSTQIVTVLQSETAFSSPVFPRANCSIPTPPEEADDNVVRPDIQWVPSFQTYTERVERLNHMCLERSTTVPNGWPTKLDAPRVWSGSDFKDQEKYITKLDKDDILEIESALKYYKGMHILALHHTSQGVLISSCCSKLTVLLSLATQRRSGQCQHGNFSSPNTWAQTQGGV
jgi:hypothetical protein